MKARLSLFTPAMNTNRRCIEALVPLKRIPFSRATLLNKIENPKLLSIVNKLYRAGAVVGSGSTADAIRYELMTGNYLSFTNHLQKGIELRDALSRLISKKELNVAEAEIATIIREDLQKSLIEEPWNKVYPGRKKI